MSLRTIRLFGLTVLSIETLENGPDLEIGDITTSNHPAGFVRDDLPTYHLDDAE